MDADAFLDDVRDAHGTELSRLSSSKAVYALTGGEMDGDAVRTGTARELHALASTLEQWSETAEGDAADLFADAADFAAETADSFDGAGGDDSGPAVTADSLPDAADERERLAGAAAAFLVLEELASQLVGFFVGDADRKRADEFREFRSELGAYRDQFAELLADHCGSDADWSAASDAGAAVVDGAYDWYVETLEGMGVEPKNVC